jgi:pseudaminic acid synthase
LKISSHSLDDRCLIVAELSANHGQEIRRAIETIRAAKRAGADAIKLQTYTADTITIDCDSECFQITGGTLWDGMTLHQLYEEAHTPWEWHETLFKIAEDEGLICFSSPFDHTAVDFLEQLNPPAYKIASFEITDTPLIEYTASKGRPMILSTGIAKYEDIDMAVKTCRAVGNNQIVLLKCTSSYPAPINEANLRTIPHMRDAFGVEVGLSDHTLGITAPAVAVALGAKVIEKHFTVDRELGGPDSTFSLDEKEFTALVASVRNAEAAVGEVLYELTKSQQANCKFARSLFVVADMKAGEIFTEGNVRSIRPGYGLPPSFLGEVLGKASVTDIARGTPLRFDLVE